MATYAPELLQQLLQLCPRTEGGTHWTQAFPLWRDLEEQGLIRVHRPVHPQTGIEYSQEYWEYELTDAGRQLIEEVCQ